MRTDSATSAASPDDHRGVVRRLIQSHPGIRRDQVLASTITAMGVQHTKSMLRALTAERILVEETILGRKHYYDAEAGFGRRDRLIVALLDHPHIGAIMRELLVHPGTHISGVARETGKFTATIINSIAALRGTSIIETGMDGNKKRLFLTDPAEVRRIMDLVEHQRRVCWAPPTAASANGSSPVPCAEQPGGAPYEGAARHAPPTYESASIFGAGSCADPSAGEPIAVSRPQTPPDPPRREPLPGAHPGRGEVQIGLLKCIRSSPGANILQITRMAGLTQDTAIVPLRQLENQGLTWSHREGRSRNYFPADLEVTDAGRIALSALNNPTHGPIVQYVAEKPGQSMSQISRSLRIGLSAMRQVIRRLERRGILETKRIGHSTYVFLTDPDSFRWAMELIEERAKASGGQAPYRALGRRTKTTAEVRCMKRSINRLGPETLDAVVAMIHAKPGISVPVIQRAQRLGRTRTRRVLELLEHQDRVWSFRRGPERRYFPPSMPRHGPESITIGRLRDPPTRRFVRYVAMNPGLQIGQLAQGLGINPNSVRHLVKHLSADGILRAESVGCKKLVSVSNVGLVERVMARLDGEGDEMAPDERDGPASRAEPAGRALVAAT